MKMATVWLWSDVMGVGIWGYYDVWPTEVDEDGQIGFRVAQGWGLASVNVMISAN